MLIPTFAGRHRNSAALISQHADGSFVTDVLRTVGMSAVRGSTNRGGARAIRQLISTTLDQHVVITPDGPRGPRRRMSLGIVFLASQTGRCIVPTAFSATTSWRIPGNWTDLIIPRPFARVFLLAGRPVRVPRSIGRTAMERYAAVVQGEMDRLDGVATELVAQSRTA
jgi:hypothetical protein